MKFAALFALFLLIDPPGKISKVNSIKSEAKDHFERGEFKEAAAQYKTLVDSMGVKEDEISMNLAHSYFQLNDTSNAQNNYMPLTNSANPKFRSVANLQLGVMANRAGKSDDALNYFKNALKADPSNGDARYNYELVKKKLEEKKKQEEQQKKNEQMEPYEFAKKLKEQADQLVLVKQYKAAFDLMNDGLKKDKTVAHYQKFIGRLGDVSKIK